MQNIADIAAFLALFVALAGPGVTFWIARRKTGSEVQLIDAQTLTEWNKARGEMQRQINTLSDELDEARVRIRSLENEGNERDRRVTNLENEVSTLTRYLRRVINQLKAAGLTPDLPPEVLEQLFKGT